MALTLSADETVYDRLGDRGATSERVMCSGLRSGRSGGTESGDDDLPGETASRSFRRLRSKANAYASQKTYTSFRAMLLQRLRACDQSAA